MRNIPIARPIVGWGEIFSVAKVLKSGSLAQGPKVLQFEKNFSKLVDDRECIAVNSGTSALHVALLSLGIGTGDEVIVPSFTFAATANSVALTGAKPVFVDIDHQTYNIDPSKIESAISDKTKAIMVVHLYGLPADMKLIRQIASRKNLLLIEDAAQAHMAEIDGEKVGTFGDAAAFSFYPTKNMTTGEGGMIVLKDPEAAKKARLLRNQGMAVRYQNEIVGFNLRMTDIHAVIGIEQLKNLSKWTEKRQQNALQLSREITEVTTPFVPNGFSHVYHQYTIRIENKRDKFSELLTSSGIGNSVYYPTEVHNLPSFKSELHLDETHKATQQVLSLPVHPRLSKSDLRRIASQVNKIGSELG
jgi:dTDP-4-amino-4,6-dideoxygalactose transaminase